ncbi:hypothetical protein C491_03015 [Natronococcus amylolyticus DSM 10524]|uniref:DUF8097 domain-containing protein n=1 Tax=Natronococcus amylolyticus DSM 10524 TaxID=1227497 RepID=L9XHT3_9EURY|nr:hypothetical protein [Natronococcus amylolyticus]ELY60233.1 hypothetical protein C491_03015 [Natronococcus amylolyticus DSM 10524]
MLSRRALAALDFLGNATAVLVQLFLRNESARVERLRREGSLENPTAESSCSGEEREVTFDDARTAFAVGVTDEMDLPTVRTRWALLGAVVAAGYRTLLDRNVAGVRRSRLRRATLIGGVWTAWFALGFDNRDRLHSLGLGSTIGALCYRARYGLLGNLPNE